jgi:hypothetical protein
MSEVKLNDSMFDERGGWTELRTDERFRQRYLIEGELFYSETLMKVRCSQESLIAALKESWTWWDKGKILLHQRNPDGTWEIELKPIYWGTTIVRHHFYPPVSLPGGKGVRIVAPLSHHFEGPATFDVYPEAAEAGVVTLRGRFHGIKQKLPIPFATARFAAKIHLKTESGMLSFPFPKGTGWVGLYRRLER